MELVCFGVHGGVYCEIMDIKICYQQLDSAEYRLFYLYQVTGCIRSWQDEFSHFKIWLWLYAPEKSYKLGQIEKNQKHPLGYDCSVWVWQCWFWARPASTGFQMYRCAFCLPGSWLGSEGKHPYDCHELLRWTVHAAVPNWCHYLPALHEHQIQLAQCVTEFSPKLSKTATRRCLSNGFEVRPNGCENWFC